MSDDNKQTLWGKPLIEMPEANRLDIEPPLLSVNWEQWGLRVCDTCNAAYPLADTKPLGNDGAYICCDCYIERFADSGDCEETS